jgi:hypothetical protein
LPFNPPKVAPGEDFLRRNIQRGNSTLRSCKDVVKSKKEGIFPISQV